MIETIVAMAVLVLLGAAILSTLTMSRRTSESSMLRSTAFAIVGGFMEQMKTMPFDNLVLSPSAGVGGSISVTWSRTENLLLSVSAGSPPDTLPAAGVVPTGAVDNVFTAQTSTTGSTSSQPVQVNMWLWVNDMANPTLRVDVGSAKRVTLIYTLTYNDGARVRTLRNSVRFLVSKVGYTRTS